MARRLLRFLAGVVVRFPGWIVLVYALLAAGAILLATTSLTLKTDQNDLVAADLEYNQVYLRFLEEFGDLEFLYVVIPVDGDPERAMAIADAVAAETRGLTEHVEWVLHRISPESLGYGLLFQDPERLARLVDGLRGEREQLSRLAGVESFAGLLELFEGLMEPGRLAPWAIGDGGGLPRELAQGGFQLLEIALAAIEEALAGREPKPLERELERALGLTPRERGYLGTTNGRLLLVEIMPHKDLHTVELIREPLIAIRAALERVRERFPGARLGLTGRPVFQADEMMTTDRDMRRVTVISLAGVFLLFVLFFRRLTRPFLSVLTLMVAIALTFGVATLSIGYLTLLSIVFAAMLVGLGIDYGIHFVARYQEELIASRSVDAAIQRTLESTGTSIATGALTTAAAFFTTLFVDFKGLRELGFMAGAGVILCFLSMVTLLPALICLVDRRSLARGRLKAPRPVQVPFLHHLGSRPRWTLAAFGALTLAGLMSFRGVRYSSNLLDLQARGLESVEYEMLLIEESDFSTWYAAFIVDSLEEVRRALEELAPAQRLGIAGMTESVLDYIPAEQERKLEILAGARQAVRGLALAAPSPEVDIEALRRSLGGLLDGIDDLAAMALTRSDVEAREAAGELGALAERVAALATELEEAPALARERLPAAQRRWLGELGALCGKLVGAFEARAITPETLPEVLRRRLLSAGGSRFLVYANPKKDIWQEDNMEEFVGAMRSVSDELRKLNPRLSDVTGAPVQVYESAWRMRDGFLLAALYSLAAVFILLLIDLRSLRDTLLAMVPLLAGLLWLVEALPHLGLEFNLANFFALPIIIGCGIDGGVYIVHRWRESGSVSEVGRTTGAAITLSYLTTMIGFGGMGFATHRGIASLGTLLVVGLASTLVASVVLLPALLNLPRLRRAATGGGGSPCQA